jgi:hypothetical protein
MTGNSLFIGFGLPRVSTPVFCQSSAYHTAPTTQRHVMINNADILSVIFRKDWFVF